MPVYIGKKWRFGQVLLMPDRQTTEDRATQLLYSIQFKLSHAIKLPGSDRGIIIICIHIMLSVVTATQCNVFSMEQHLMQQIPKWLFGIFFSLNHTIQASTSQQHEWVSEGVSEWGKAKVGLGSDKKHPPYISGWLLLALLTLGNSTALGCRQHRTTSDVRTLLYFSNILLFG